MAFLLSPRLVPGLEAVQNYHGLAELASRPNEPHVRYFEFGESGERTGRQIIIKDHTPKPPPADGAQLRLDPTSMAEMNF
jgi:hypothetical protein